MCNANSSKERQIFFVMAHTQRWTNIGLSIVFFFIGLFVHTLLKTDLPNWWVSLTDNTIVSLAFDVLLFIPLAILLFLCISAYITINEVLGRILLLVWFSFLMSLFLLPAVFAGILMVIGNTETTPCECRTYDDGYCHLKNRYVSSEECSSCKRFQYPD